MSTLTPCFFSDLYSLAATKCLWLRADLITPFNTDFTSGYDATSAALKHVFFQKPLNFNTTNPSVTQLCRPFSEETGEKSASVILLSYKRAPLPVYLKCH